MKNKKFPSIHRFITDLPNILFTKIHKVKLSRRWKIGTISLLGFVMTVLIGISGFDLYYNFQEKKKLNMERQKIVSKIQYWQGIVKQYNDYRDAYFQLAILEYRLRDFVRSKLYLDKALALDPNFEEGRKLEKVLNTK